MKALELARLEWTFTRMAEHMHLAKLPKSCFISSPGCKIWESCSFLNMPQFSSGSSRGHVEKQHPGDVGGPGTEPRVGPIVLHHLGLRKKGPGGRRDVSDAGHQGMKLWEGTFLPVPWEERAKEAWVDMRPPASCLFFFLIYAWICHLCHLCAFQK